METLIYQVEWIPAIVGAVAAFALGWLWYSPYMFMKGWLEGIGDPVWRAPIWMPMVVQAGSTLLLAIVANILFQAEAVWFYILVTVVIIGFIKANGLYGGKTKYAITVEVGYLLAMAIMLYVVNLIF